jgi:molecular chaperone GrpE
MSESMNESADGGPVIRDKRRIDPDTGEVRPATAAAAPADPPVVEDELADVVSSDLVAVLDERTADLQRLQAEFANYRRRVERNRQLVADQALASVLVGLLPILDDIDRARAHGEVEGGFKLVADGLETTLTKLGLERFGDAGEPFDPTVHEALTHAYTDDVDSPTCAEVYQPGYRVGDRVLRPARVAVAEPATPAADDSDAAMTTEAVAADEPTTEPSE